MSEGPLASASVVLSSRTVTGTGTAKAVTAVVRRIEVEEDRLHYDLDMAAVGVVLTGHLSATLHRVSAPSG